MQIQPITNQPNVKGKVVFEPKTTYELTKDMPRALCRKFKDVATLVSGKPYDIFVSRNAQDPRFYDIAANKTLEEAQKVKEYTVKIQSDIMLASVVDAAKDAMEMYENFIAKSIKG